METQPFHDLAHDIQAFLDSCSHLLFDIPELTIDMRHFCVLLMAVGQEQVSARAVRAAVHGLEDVPRCILFWELLKESTPGKHVTSEYLMILETGASDDVGDRRLQMAMAFMSGSKVANICVKDGLAVLHNPEGCTNGLVYLSMLDVVGHTLECRRIWSQARCSDAAQLEGPTLSKAMYDIAGAANLGMMLRYHELYHESLSDLALHCGPDLTGESFQATQPIFKAIFATSRQHAIRFTEQMSFLTLYKQQAELAKESPKEDFLQELYQYERYEAMDQMLQYSLATMAVIQALGFFAGGGVVYQDARLETAAWSDIASADASTEPTCFLHCALRTIEETQALRSFNVWKVSGLDEAEFTAITVAGWADDAQVATAQLCSFFEGLARHPFTQLVTDYVLSQVSLLIQEFQSKCELEAIAAGDVELLSEATLSRKVMAFLRPANMPSTAAAATQWFENGAAFGAQWH